MSPISFYDIASVNRLEYNNFVDSVVARLPNGANTTDAILATRRDGNTRIFDLWVSRVSKANHTCTWLDACTVVMRDLNLSVKAAVAEKGAADV